MRLELVPGKVYFRFFDKYFKDSSNIYIRSEDKDANTMAEINKNRQAVAAIYGKEDIVILRQVHGNEVIEINKEHVGLPEQIGDASFTSQAGVVLGILTADCVPVLVASTDGKLIGAAHCGWRSAKKDILHQLAFNMYAQGAKKLVAAIGPAIQQNSYEVSHDYYQDFIADNLYNREFFKPSSKEEHFMFNLPAYVRAKLTQENIDVVYEVNEDTYTNPDKYISKRYLDHNNISYKQNILSTIMIAD